MNNKRRVRVLLLALGGIALIAALWGGLIRIGWRLPAIQTGFVAAHGPLMISGFLGTVIGLERAVATRKSQTYFLPLFSGLGAVTILIGLPVIASGLLITLSSIGLTILYLNSYRTHRAAHTMVMAIGSLCWAIGNVLWIFGQSLPLLIAWWVAFLVLTITGERLELSRVLRLSRFSQRAFLFVVGLFLMSLLLTLFAHDLGLRSAGLALFLLAIWLLRYDVAGRTVRQTGLQRYIAICLLLGYVWLGVAGILWMVWGSQYSAGPIYDALLHSLLVGFVFSMIFGHAPIIFPSILSVSIPYSSSFYVQLGLLHVSLLARIAGDLTSNHTLRRWGGLLNALAILIFIFNTARAARKTVRQTNSQAAD